MGRPSISNDVGTINDVVTQDMVNNYLQAFKSNNVGWAYYSWDPVYDFAIKDQSYQDTIYKSYLQNGINSIYGENVSNTSMSEINSAIIDKKYQELGGNKGFLGYPISDERITQDATSAHFRFYQGGSIYWTPETGPYEKYNLSSTNAKTLEYDNRDKTNDVTEDFNFEYGNRFWGIKNWNNVNSSDYKFGKNSYCNDNAQESTIPNVNGKQNYAKVLQKIISTMKN